MGQVTPTSISGVSLHPPEKLTDKHNVEDFCSGEEILDNWLKEKGLKNELGDASRTYVVCADTCVVGYYSLAAGSIQREVATKKMQRNMPDVVPIMLLARLAVDENWQGKGVGPGLLRDAILRTLQASEIAGIKALLAHAISEKAKAFYEHHGFKVSPLEPMTLMITIKEIRASL